MLSSPTAVKLLHRSFLENPMLIKKELFCKRNTVPLFTRPLELPFDSHYIFFKRELEQSLPINSNDCSRKTRAL